MRKERPLKLTGITVLVFLVCILLVVTGCGKKTGDGQQVVTEEMKQTLDEATGQHFDFSLESNPTTGYSWQVAQAPDSNIVQLVNSYFAEPSGDLVGAPGEEVWQFQAVAAGTATTVLEYSQLWDTATPPAKRYTLTINVVQAGNEISESFKVEAGNTFNFTLDTNPSTGYSWQLSQQPDANILKLVSNNVTAASAIGAPQSQVWIFQGVSAGSTSFILEYTGPGTNAPVDKKDTAKATVTAAPTPTPTPPKVYTDPATPITATPGEVFILEVKNQAGTAYEWQLAGEINTVILKFMGPEARALGSEPGSPTVTDFTFESLGTGQQTIKLGLYMAGADNPTQVVQFNVTLE